MSLRRIIHVAQITLQPTSGMGRIACEWEAAAKRAGIEFVHLGPNEIGPVRHRLFFPPKARKLADERVTEETLLLVHEPCAWAFRSMAVPKVAFSHGIELRGAEIELAFEKVRLKSRITRPILNWLGFRGLAAMNLILVSNSDDRQYLVDRAIAGPDRVKIFRNGTDPVSIPSKNESDSSTGMDVVFNGSWLRRKGIDVLVRAAVELSQRGIHPHWFLMGTIKTKEEVLASWPGSLHTNLTITPHFQRGEEAALLGRAQVFVLPSYFEGQSLALSQAMAAGLCCITTNCCGQKDVIRHGENGLLFAPGSHEELANCIQQAWEKPAWGLELGVAAKASMAVRTWQATANEIIGWLWETDRR